MQKQTYSFTEFNFSSQLIRDLVSHHKNIKPFVQDFFSAEQILKQIQKKDFTQQQRDTLVSALKEQNKNIQLSDLSKQNIELLKNKSTYTITTGHQLNLLTGPLYSVYKILQVIVWTEKLNLKHKDFNFVPVFWMATEDHDFEEINHIHLFNQKIEWQKKGQDNFIAGAIKTDTLFETDFAQPILDLFKDEKLKAKIATYLSYYKNTNLANATRLLLNDLFGEYGLVIIDGNDKSLKQQFTPVVEQELTQQITKQSVEQTNKKLTDLGYHNQVFLRDCNLFYIENQTTRHRIVKTDTAYKINGIVKTKNELIDEAKQHPERFSPNALLRPVYQEIVLPNLCYFGGGGEIAYWLQLKDLFDTLQITYPLLRVRDSYILLNNKQIKQLADLKLDVLSLKQNYDDLIKDFVKNNTSNKITLEQENHLLNELKVSLQSKTRSNNDGLSRFIEGEMVKMSKQLDKIEKKLLQNEKKNQEQTLNQIKRLRDKIYPNNGFQERYENFLQYAHQPGFIDSLKKELNQLTIDQAQISIVVV